MDYIIWHQILYELVSAVSGEKDLEKLAHKAATAFLKKLNCAQVSILQMTNKHLKSICTIPKILLKDTEYNHLIQELEHKLALNKEQCFYLHQDLYLYGFTLEDFGLLLIGRSKPIESTLLKEIIPITNILARNCYFNFETSQKQQKIKDDLQKERQLLRVIMHTIPDLVFYKDLNGVYKEINEATAEFFGLKTKTINNQTVWDLHSLREANKCWETDFEVSQIGRTKRYETELQDKYNDWHPFEVLKAPLFNDDDLCIGTVSVCRDIKTRKHYEKELEYIGTHDQLTGLYNRRFLEREISFLDTQEELPISIIMGDLNSLKLVNDMYGHQVGDRMIFQAARIIKRSCRNSDFVIRWGGDEFVVFLPRTNAEIATRISRRIKENCDAEKCEEVPIKIALGWATKKAMGTDIWQIFKQANENMYKAKVSEADKYKNQLLDALQIVLAQKSIETEEHIQRVRLICRKIGKRMKLDQMGLKRLDLLARYHDIGKVTIKKSILLKPTTLTANEWEEIKNHCQVGYRFALSIPKISAIADCILAHHEHWDGRGYPQGLQERQIPLLARILTVADAFDSMTHNTIYSPALSSEEARKIIKQNAGKQFDPDVVQAFQKIKLNVGKSIQSSSKQTDLIN